MNDSPETRTLRDYIRVLRQRRLLVLSVVLLCVGAALAYAAAKERSYEAATTVSFKDESADLRVAGIPVGPSFQPEKQAAANARIVTSEEVVTRVKNSLGLSESSEQVRGQVSTEVDPDSNLVEIRATDDEAQGATDLANAFALATRAAVRERDRESYEAAANRVRKQLRSVDDPATEAAYRSAITRLITLSTLSEPAEINRPAEVPSSPASPKPLRDAMLAAILGFLLGIGAAFVRDALDRRLTDSHQIQHIVGIPLVGYVREDTLGRVGLADNGARGFSEDDLEAFRILRTNVDFLVKEGELRSLAVTSGVPEEGKSTVAAWFAYASALAGRRTLLVECDFRRPVLASRLGIEEEPGLSDYLDGNGEVKPTDILRPLPVRGALAAEALPVIPAGRTALQPAEMIASQNFHHFLEQVCRAYDFVVVDTAPILPVGDTLELLPQVDAALLCVRLGQTTRDQAEATRAAIAHLPEMPIGLVVTGIRPGSEDDYYGYYSYGPSPRVGASA